MKTIVIATLLLCASCGARQQSETAAPVAGWSPTGRLLDIQIGGTSAFSIDVNGQLHLAPGVTPDEAGELFADYVSRQTGMKRAKRQECVSLRGPVEPTKARHRTKYYTGGSSNTGPYPMYLVDIMPNARDANINPCERWDTSGTQVCEKVPGKPE